MIVGAQWGDEGKGKIVDLLAQDADVVCRYQGGPNAGHTIIVDGETFKIRQVPSGAISGTSSKPGERGRNQGWTSSARSVRCHVMRRIGSCRC